MQPVEIEPAQLAAAHALLDAGGVRVLDTTRIDKRGPLAILATPTLGETPPRTCLAAMLHGDRPVTWLCPPRLQRVRVLVAAEAAHGALAAVGVARGDVRRIVLRVPGLEPMTRYTHGDNWGQFDAVVAVQDGPARLLVYGPHGLVQTIVLNVRPGTQRVFE